MRIRDGAGGGLEYNPDSDQSGSLNLIACTIIGNTAGDYGAGIKNSGTLNLTNVNITHNTAPMFGGGILNFYDPPTVGTINFSGENLIAENTLTDESALNGSAVYNQGTASAITGLNTVSFDGNDPEADQCHNCPSLV